MRDHPGADVLGTLLRHVRITTSRFGRIELGAPWGVRIGARDTVSLHHLLEGRLWLEVAGRQVHARAGDFLLLPHGLAHALRHRPEAPVEDAPAEDARAEDMEDAPGQGLSTRRRYGGDGPVTVLLCAELELTGAARNRLVRALGPLVHLPADEDGREPVPGLEGLLALLRDEIRGPRPGTALFASRLAELLLLQAIRVELSRHTAAGSWRAALEDEGVARSLDAIYGTPEHAWSVAGLARVAGMSRTTFTQRFRTLVGEGPFTHLTRWRMDLAQDLLRGSGRSLADIATAVGYADEFAFGTAFRRVVGVPPGTYRSAHRKS